MLLACYTARAKIQGSVAHAALFIYIIRVGTYQASSCSMPSSARRTQCPLSQCGRMRSPSHLPAESDPSMHVHAVCKTAEEGACEAVMQQSHLTGA